MQNEGNLIYETGTNLAAQGAFTVQKNGVLLFAGPQWVDKTNPFVALQEDQRTVALAAAIEIDKMQSSARRRNRTAPTQNSSATNFDMKPALRRVNNYQALKRTAPKIVAAPKVAAQPIMSNSRRDNVTRIDSSPLFKSGARAAKQDYSGLKSMGGTVLDIAIGFATGGPVGAVLAMASRAQAASPSGKVIGINAKRDMFASPKQKALARKNEMELVLVECEEPETKLRHVPGQKQRVPVTVMKKHPRWVQKPKLLALTA